MNVVLNGEPSDLEQGTTAADVVVLFEKGPRGIAVAVNEEIIPRSRWSSTTLHEGDRVEVLTAAAGG